MKKCFKCKAVKENSEYSKNKAKKDGVEIYCKACIREKRKRWYITHWKNYYQRNKVKVTKYKREYYILNKEKELLRAKEYREANRKKTRVSTMNWCRANPIKCREASRKSRALKCTTQTEPINDKIVFMRDGWICQICHKRVDKKLRYPNPMSASLDHITPLSQGGTHTYSNMQLTHFGCNSGKRDRLLPQGEQTRLF